MATAHQIRGLITQTTSGKAHLRVLREVGYEVCCYATRCCRQGSALCADRSGGGLEVRKLHFRRGPMRRGSVGQRNTPQGDPEGKS